MMAEPAVLTPLQLCGFDPVPSSPSSLVDVESLPSVEPQPNLLELLQHQAHMQAVILQQFQQLEMFKSMLFKVVMEQQQQRQYIQSLEEALLKSLAQLPRQGSPIPTQMPVPKTTEVPPKEHKQATSSESKNCSSTGSRSSSDLGGISDDGQQSLAEAQKRDSAIKRVRELKLCSSKRMSRRKMEKECPEVRRLLQVWDRLKVKDGLLLYRKGGDKPHFLVVLPRRLRPAVFARFHTTMEMHGYGRVLKLVREKYFWPSLHDETMAYMRRHRRHVHGETTLTDVGHVPPPIVFQDGPS